MDKKQTYMGLCYAAIGIFLLSLAGLTAYISSSAHRRTPHHPEDAARLGNHYYMALHTEFGPNLACWWKFDEGHGSIAYDSAGNNHAIIHGAQWVTGCEGGALRFDGVDDHVSISQNNLPSSGPYSISMWLYAIGDHKSRYVVGGHDQDACWIHYYVNDNARFTIGSDDRGSGRLVMKDANNKNFENYRLLNDEWAHLAVVFDSNGSFERVCRNGVETKNVYRTPGHSGYTDKGWDFSGTDTVIGKQGDASGYFKGSIDDVRIYNAALSAEEITRLYQQPR